MMMERRVLRVRPRRMAAVARPYTDLELTEREARRALPDEIDAMAHTWAYWYHTRRYFGPPSRLPSIIGKLRTRTPMATDGSAGPNAFCSRDVAIFHRAVVAAGDGPDRMVFELYYRLRPSPVKTLARELGINPRQWYSLRNSFARRAWALHGQMLVTQNWSKLETQNT